MQRAGVRAIVANSRPNDGTPCWPMRATRRARPASPWCRSCACTATAPTTPGWFADASIHRDGAGRAARGTPAGPYRGLGEFHLYDSANADGAIAARADAVAQARDLVVLAHVDDVAIES